MKSRNQLFPQKNYGLYDVAILKEFGNAVISGDFDVEMLNNIKLSKNAAEI